MILPLQSLMAGIFFLFTLGLSRIYRTQTCIYPLFLVLILRMPSLQISWLQVAAWVLVSVPLYFLLLFASLNFDFNRLISLL